MKINRILSMALVGLGLIALSGCPVPIPVTNPITYVMIPVGGGSISGPTAVITGAAAALTATTNAGYTFESVTASNGSITGTYPYFMLNSVTAATTVTIRWTTVPVPVNVPITYVKDPSAGGTISGPATVLTGTSASLTATSNVGYTFASLTASNGAITGAFPNFTLSGVTAATTVTITWTADPDPQAEYDAGFDDGFAVDAKYWEGYDDSYYTFDGSPILYSGADIPSVTEPPYDSGYYDGLWYAYNDGYFVSYDDSFTIGFSEGYAAAYASDWEVFLANDIHVEWMDGGFSDGYNDGFSEGRIFGAWDYENLWAFDWFNAMTDYRGGTDLSIGGISTGVDGPVTLYEYGVDPHDFWGTGKSTVRKMSRSDNPSVRNSSDAKATPVLTYRAISETIQNDYNVDPATSLRGDRNVNINLTWLERVQAYRDYLNSKSTK